MPKVKMCRPETDKIKALILERQNAYGYNQEKMAELSGYSRTTYIKMMKAPTKTWKLQDILNLCRALDIPKDEVRAAI